MFTREYYKNLSKLGSPQSQENITNIEEVRQSIVTREYYNNFSMLDSPQSQESITNI